jgi:hypothetical protein
MPNKYKISKVKSLFDNDVTLCVIDDFIIASLKFRQIQRSAGGENGGN